jgi:hypothetical protein
MKLCKILSVVTSAILTISSSLVIASAQEDYGEYGMGDLQSSYTLEELFEMSDNDFFRLYNAQSYYEEIKDDTERYNKLFDTEVYGGISGYITNFGTETDYYQANITESQLEELLGDTVNYEISSPINSYKGDFTETEIWLSNWFSVTFPDYNLYAGTDNIDDTTIMEFAKCWYCINQVLPVQYATFGYDIDASSNLAVTFGDVNVSGTVDVFDAIYIAKDSVGTINFTDFQKKVGDMNGDGECDVFDAIAVAKETVQ